MAKAKAKKIPNGKAVAHFLLGNKIAHEIVVDRSSASGYSVKHGPGHYMAIPQRTIEEILEYGKSQGFTAVAL